MLIQATRRSFVAATFAFAAIATILPAAAEVPTDHASNSYEYRAYTNAYSAWAITSPLPEAVFTQMNVSSNNAEFEALMTELYWTETFVGFVDAAFLNAYNALMNDDDSQWDPCVDNLITAIDSGELLIEVMDSTDHVNSSRRQTVQSSLFYLSQAVENASFASLTSSQWGTNSIASRSTKKSSGGKKPVQATTEEMKKYLSKSVQSPTKK